MTKGSPAGVQHVLGTDLTYYCRQWRTKLLLRLRTETEQPLAKAPDPILTEHCPQNTTRDTVECLLQIHKAHVELVGQTPINPQAPCGEYRAGPVFHDRDENCIVAPESEGLDYRPNSPLQYPGVDLPSREAEKCDPPVVGTHSPVPLFKKRDHHPWFATPEALSPTSMQCCRGVSAKTAPQHPET
ncbi:hypothetical protein L3Q82_006172 [Scortum barcoo]|uniref:Uncharacterized protein n=1 Tax=Scortum barcoo TaxID=214431 RepID=A0ACB8X1Z2_9TELE|nr:hypothetical protein L3Q82_006172 [Scortum barcoo]